VGWSRREFVEVSLLAAALLAGGRAVHRFWTHELYHFTGDAEWVWVTDALERVHPAAGLFVGSVTLDSPPSRALLKICGDREYVAYVNATPAACGWSRPGFRLDLYDVAHLLKQGRNVIAIEVRSPTPVGGLLLALDVDGVGRNVLVSGPALRFRERFTLGPTAPDDRPVAISWGHPPRFPWGYPELLSHAHTLDQAMLEDPVRVEVASAKLVGGGGYLFELPRRVNGYLWVEWQNDGPAFLSTVQQMEGLDSWLERMECQPVVRLPGQRRWLDPEPRQIAAVLVFGASRPLAVEVWPLADALSSTAPGVVPGKLGLLPRTRWTIRTPPG
jgi:hypothetical protein